MIKRFFCIAAAFMILLSAMCTLVGCGKKEEQKIVYSTIIVIGNESQNETDTSSSIKLNKKLFQTYEQLINAESIKSKIKKQYGSVGNIELENIEDTQMVKVIYVCDNHTDDECKALLNDWIAEFTRAVKELYNIKEICIVDEPQITTRTVKK